MPKDPYVTLHIERDATPGQIQAAYKHWAKEIQPSKDSPAGEEMQHLQDAYAVLGHPKRRREHAHTQGAEPLKAPQGPGGTRQIWLRESFETFHPSFEELFERFWANFDLVTRPKAERLESLTIEVPLTPEEAHMGGNARIMIPARAQCPTCFGHGAVGCYQCWHCGGQGSITADYPIDLSYPPGLLNEHTTRVPLEQFGIRNFYLTVRFRVSSEEPI